MDPFDPNYAFTSEGIQQAIDAIGSEYGAQVPQVLPEGQPGSSADAAFVGSGTQTGQSGGPSIDPALEAAVRNTTTAAEAAARENLQLRQMMQNVTAAAARAEEQQFQASLDDMTPRDAIRAVQQRAMMREMSLRNQVQQVTQEAQNAAMAGLVTGFTQEIYRHYPDLDDGARQLIESVADPDARAAIAAYAASVSGQLNQLARSQTAAMHVASGAGRVGGVQPVAAGTAAGPSNRPLTAREIIAQTPWEYGR